MSSEPRIWLELRTSKDIAVAHQPCSPSEKRQNFMLSASSPRSLSVSLADLRQNQHLTTIADSSGNEVDFILKYEGKEDVSKHINRYCPITGKLLDSRSPVGTHRGCVVGFSSARAKEEFERKDSAHSVACAYLDVLVKELLGELPGGAQVSSAARERIPELLVQGAEFVKHAVGRGQPAPRRVQVQDHAVCWKKPNAVRASSSKRIPLDAIIGVKSGKQTGTFSKKSSVAAPSECCFSLLSANRSLDLQAPSMSLRDQWVEAFNGLLQARQGKTTIHLPSTTNQSTPTLSHIVPVMSLPKAEATNVIVAGLGLRLLQETFVNPGIIVFRSEGKSSEKLENLECIHRSTLTMGTRCPEFGVQLVNPPPRFIRICVFHAPSAQVWGQSLTDVLHSSAVSLIGSVIVDVPSMVRNSGARLPFLGHELDLKKGIGGLMGCGLMLTVDENKEDMNLQEAIDMLLAGETVTAYTASDELEQFTEGTGLRNSLPVETLKLRLVPQGALPEGTRDVAPLDTLIGALVLERTRVHGPGDTKVLSLESISDMYEGPQTAVFAAHFDKELLPRSVRACSFSIVSVFQKTTWNLEARNGRVRDGIIQAVYTLMTDGWPGLSSPLGAVVTTDIPPQVNENLGREDSESTVPEVRDWGMAADISKNGAMPSFGDYEYDTELSTVSSACSPNMHWEDESRTAKYEFSSEAKSQSQVSSGLFAKFEVAPRNNGGPRFSVSHTGGISIIRGASLTRQQPSMTRTRHNSTSSRASLSTASLISVVSQVHGGTRQIPLQDYLDSASKKKRVDREVESVNSMSRDRWSKRAAGVKPVEEKTVHAEMDSDPAIQSLFFELGSIKKSASDHGEPGRRPDSGSALRAAGGSNRGIPSAVARSTGAESSRGISASGGLARGMSSSSSSSNGSSSSSCGSNGSSRGGSSVARSASARNQPSARTPSQGPNEFANLLSLQNDIQDLKRMIQRAQ